MPDLNTPDYYRRREAQEHALASRASLPAIAAIHHDLAERYHRLAMEAADARPRLQVVS